MAISIALFNHKGGVSKTTTTFNLGWMLASKGKTVVMVDTDPQCNLTGMVLGYQGQSDFASFYEQQPQRNIRAGLEPAFESQPKLISGVDCVPVAACPHLYLLPGHVAIAEYEVTLGIAQELSATIVTLKNLPGAVHYLLQKTADKFNADYLLIDMGPSLSAFNQNILMTSDYFIIPTYPDYFSVMALDSLARILKTWHGWATKARTSDVLLEADYPFPQITTRFLGTIVQNFRPRGDGPALAFQHWVDKIKTTVEDTLVPVLERTKMMLNTRTYGEELTANGYRLALIPNFNSLIAQSQKYSTAVFALTDAQLERQGVVLEITQNSQKQLQNQFEDLAEKIIRMTSVAAID